MAHAAWLRDEEDTFTIGGRTYAEAAGYIASFIAYVHQRAPDGSLTVEAQACLSPQDQRVLR